MNISKFILASILIAMTACSQQETVQSNVEAAKTVTVADRTVEN